MNLNYSARFVISELELSLGCAIQYKDIPPPTRLKRSNGVYEMAIWGGYLRFKRGSDFTVRERKFIRTVIDSYDKISSKLSSRGVTSQYLQTSITSSVFDIAISRFIAQSRRHFLNIHRLIQYLKLLSYEKYEGEQVKVGFFVKKTDVEDIEELKLNNSEYEIIQSDHKARITQELLRDSAFLRYVNGSDSFYICDTNLDILGFLNIISNGHDSFRSISGKNAEDIMKYDEDIYFYAGVTSNSDVEIFINDKYRLLFRKGRWHFIDCQLVNRLTSENHKEIDPWRIYYSMSKIHKGTVTLSIDKSTSLKGLVARHTSDEKGMRNSIKNCILGATIDRLCETGELFRILTTDGITIFNKNFSSVIDFNAIVNISTAESEAGGGGRTSAAISGSNFGIAIKVSEDGPITIYKDSKSIYKVG